MKSNAAMPVWAVFLDVEAADPRPPRPPRLRDAWPREAGPLPVAAEEDLVRPPPLFPRTIAGIWRLCSEWVWSEDEDCTRGDHAFIGVGRLPHFLGLFVFPTTEDK